MLDKWKVKIYFKNIFMLVALMFFAVETFHIFSSTLLKISVLSRTLVVRSEL